MTNLPRNPVPRQCATEQPPTFRVLIPEQQDYFLLKELLAKLNRLEELAGLDRTKEATP